jgi:hypothetical protein
MHRQFVTLKQGTLSPWDWDRRMVKLREAFGEPCLCVRMPFTEQRRQRRFGLREGLPEPSNVEGYNVACLLLMQP